MTAPRVRIAPSPTGYFHVGTARTALYNWLYARQHAGTFVLRIEDTDAARNRPQFTEGIVRAMEWLGLGYDEGPYFQSERGDLYAKAIDQLLAEGKVYACDCDPSAIQSRAAARGGPPGYDGYCRTRGLDPTPGRMLRFRTPDTGETYFEDVIQATTPVQNSTVEDFGIRKSNGSPLFLLANVVDDADMAISHVIRGNDHQTNTTKYLMLWEALGYGAPPVFAHTPLLLNDARKKLSKRRDKVAVEDYRDDGYLPEAFVNYLALLGWAPAGDREILTRAELLEEFRLEDVKSAGAIFDEKKLQAVNSDYLRAMPPEEFVARTQSWMASRWQGLAVEAQERSRTLGEVWGMVDFLLSPTVAIDANEWDKAVGKQPAFAAILDAARDEFTNLEFDWAPEAIQAAVQRAGDAAGVPQLGKAQAPIRLACTGKTVGLPLWQSLATLGRDKTLARLAAARARLG